MPLNYQVGRYFSTKKYDSSVQTETFHLKQNVTTIGTQRIEISIILYTQLAYVYACCVLLFEEATELLLTDFYCECVYY